MSKITKPFTSACLEMADNEHSKLGERERSLYGRSSSRLRAFINNICSKENINYLEIGVDRGSTIISAVYGNSQCKAVGIENFKYDEKEFAKVAKDKEVTQEDGSIKYEPTIWENMRSQLFFNIDRYGSVTDGEGFGSIDIIQSDFQEVDWSSVPKADVCFFDVKPVNADVYDAFFEKVVPNLANPAVVIFSNYSNDTHAKQVEEAFANHHNTVTILWDDNRVSSGLSDATQYFSGIGIFGISKKIESTENNLEERIATANAITNKG